MQLATLTPTRHRKRTVLLIDGDVTSCHTVVEALRPLQLDVITADSGIGGLQLFQKQQQDIGLVLIDVDAPLLNAPETFERLRQLDGNVKVILASNYPQAEALLHCGQRAYDAIVKKPFKAQTLINIARTAFE